MISKTKIRKRTKKKTDDYIVETINSGKKNKAWFKILQMISGPRRKYTSVNLKEIDSKTKEGDTIIVPGKVLAVGDVTKRVRVCALYFSESAEKKLKMKKGEVVTILEEIKNNPKMEGVKIIV